MPQSFPPPVLLRGGICDVLHFASVVEETIILTDAESLAKAARAQNAERIQLVTDMNQLASFVVVVRVRCDVRVCFEVVAPIAGVKLCIEVDGFVSP